MGSGCDKHPCRGFFVIFGKVLRRMSKRKKRAKIHRRNEITKGIFTILEQHPDRAFTYKELASILNVVDTSGRNDLIRKLGQLKQEGRIVEVSRGRYQLPPMNLELVEGVLDVNSAGNGYVTVEELEEDVFVLASNMGGAFHKDQVRVSLKRKKGDGRREGEIVEVLKRYRTQFVGVIELSEKFAFVRPQDSRMYVDFFINLGQTGGAKSGDKVLVEFISWENPRNSPLAKVVKVLGKPGEHNTEIHAILAEYGLPYQFEANVEDYANAIDTRITDTEIARRRDFRHTLTFTIDPKDAKDFDDALSFKILPNGNYEIGIHIADVSHYLKPGNMLDDEAFNRGTSVYLVDRVVPMLPEILSNNACSLRPNEEKYTYSAVFEIDDQANVRDEWFGRTVIESDERFAYEEAQHIIETGDCHIPEKVSIREEGEYEVADMVREAVLTLDRLAKIMRERRMKMGAISFDKVEVKFQLNAENEPTGVFFKESRDANKLIEEFMLLANKRVASFIGKRQPRHTFVYRIHDEPDPDKLIALNGVISKFGHTVDLRNKKSISQDLNRLLADVKGKPEQNLVDTLTIRSMSKAKYSTDNIGHYGLAFDYYTHFTSPIRRYPDVMVHRLLEHYLEGGKPVKESEYEEMCEHCSQREILATQAERDSIKYMQIKYMQEHQNEEFLGVISGVTEWGMYVEIIENKCEGMVRIREIKGDYFFFDAKNYAIVGSRTQKKFVLGDEVTVMVKDIDLEKRHLDFSLIQVK